MNDKHTTHNYYMDSAWKIVEDTWERDKNNDRRSGDFEME